MDTQETLARPKAPTNEAAVPAWREASDHYVAALAPILAARLREARRGRRRADVAHAVGLHENTIAKFERGEAVPSAFDLVRLALLYEVEPCRFLLSAEERPQETVLSGDARETDDQVLVPFFDVKASAGSGAFSGAENVQVMRPFASDYIRRELGVTHNNLAIVTVTGSSMEPMIHSGDVVLIDRKDTEIAVEGPHLVRVDGYLVVKIAERRPGGIVRLSSVNPSFEPFEIALATASDFEVLGRVRWAGVTFK